MLMKFRISNNYELLLDISLYLLLLYFLFLPIVTLAENEGESLGYAGEIVSFSGDVSILRSDQNNWQLLTVKSKLHMGDSLKTYESGRVTLLLADETLLKLNRNSHFTLKSVQQNAGWLNKTAGFLKVSQLEKSVYRLFSGELWARNKNKDIHVEFHTPSVAAGIRGTEINLRVLADLSVVSVVLEGRVKHWNEYGQVIAETGSQVVTRLGKAPIKSLLINPLHEVQWTLVVPPVFGYKDLVELTKTQQRLLSLKQKSPQQKLNLSLLQALLNIHRSNPSKAKQQLEVHLELAPEDDSAWRLLAVSELMLNNKQAAQLAAQKSVSLFPESAENLITLAYVNKSFMKLNEALENTYQALQYSPNNSLALTLLAELQFSSGYTDKAWSTINRAKRLEENNARILNLMGFILLAKQQTEKAQTSFTQALAQDAEMAESHLGLGLVMMRLGRVEEALLNITQAVALDPQRALFVSYWGKMLYQVKRYHKAFDMFRHSINLDPADPTGWFYQAIILRDLNRPGEAIRALKQAVGLNDNKGVYRSRFLLDQDLAVRNLDLSLLYRQLGLSSWASHTAIKALKADGMNASAHLFYAQSLSEQENRSYAFASESLLARLLQSANLNTFNTFNQYTSFFEQPDSGGQLTLDLGEYQQSGEELIFYGAQPDKHLAYSLLLGNKNKDGWRDNHFDRESSAALLGKWDLGEKQGLFFSTVFSEVNQGDNIDRRYEYDAPEAPDNRTFSRLSQAELGYVYRQSPSSQYLAYLGYAENRGNLSTHSRELITLPALYLQEDTSSDFKRPSLQLQLQSQQREGNHQWLAGMLLLKSDIEIKQEENASFDADGVITPIAAFSSNIKESESTHFYSLYLKDNWKLLPELSAEFYLYVDQMKNANPINNQSWVLNEVNPGVGFIWNPSSQHYIRLASFRYLLPFVSARLDPVEIAGIAMSRNNREGVISEETDLVWEYEWESGFVSSNVFYVKSLYQDHDMDFKGEQKGYELNWNQLVTNQLGAVVDYRYGDIEDVFDSNLDRDDQLLGLQLNYLAINGFSVGIKQQFRQIEFENDRKKEGLGVTDIRLAYEVNSKEMKFELEVLNLLDNHFNWLTDEFSVQGVVPARTTIFSFIYNF